MTAEGVAILNTVGIDVEEEAWMRSGACRGKDPDWFFPTRGQDNYHRLAVACCAVCPVKAECLDYGFGPSRS